MLDSEFGNEGNWNKIMPKPELYFLIEQAERVQELEKEKLKALKRAKDFEKECKKLTMKLGSCHTNYNLLHENSIRMIGALEFYADKKKYYKQHIMSDVDFDAGYKARKALEGSE